jgi:hypothetical protein
MISKAEGLELQFREPAIGRADHAGKELTPGRSWRLVRKSRAKGGRRSFTVVDPFRQDAPEMPLVERNHPIESFAPCAPDEAFTMRVRLRRAHKSIADFRETLIVPIVSGVGKLGRDA